MPLDRKSRVPKSTERTPSRFANVNGVRLHYLIAGKGDPVVLLHGYAETSHMWHPLIPKLAATGTRYRSGFARSRPVVYTPGRLHQSGNGAGHPRSGGQAWIPAHSDRWARYRLDGGVRLCGAISGRGGSDCVDGRFPAWCRRLAQRVAHEGSVAFPFLREDAARTGTRPGAHLFRTFLERLRRRPQTFRPRRRPPYLR